MVRLQRFLPLFLLMGLTCLLGGFSCHPKPKSDLPVVSLKMDGHEVWVEVANKDATRSSGLMFRQQMDWNNGMLFVFPDINTRAFWMKNTLIPLSIAFIDEEGNIINVAEMVPQSEESIWSSGPAKYALEMNSGWFMKEGVKAGDKVEGVLNAPKAQD